MVMMTCFFLGDETITYQNKSHNNEMWKERKGMERDTVAEQEKRKRAIRGRMAVDAVVSCSTSNKDAFRLDRGRA